MRLRQRDRATRRPAATCQWKRKMEEAGMKSRRRGMRHPTGRHDEAAARSRCCHTSVVTDHCSSPRARDSTRRKNCVDGTARQTVTASIESCRMRSAAGCHGQTHADARRSNFAQLGPSTPPKRSKTTAWTMVNSSEVGAQRSNRHEIENTTRLLMRVRVPMLSPGSIPFEMRTQSSRVAFIVAVLVIESCGHMCKYTIEYFYRLV